MRFGFYLTVTFLFWMMCVSYAGPPENFRKNFEDRTQHPANCMSCAIDKETQQKLLATVLSELNADKNILPSQREKLNQIKAELQTPIHDKNGLEFLVQKYETETITLARQLNEILPLPNGAYRVSSNPQVEEKMAALHAAELRLLVVSKMYVLNESHQRNQSMHVLLPGLLTAVAALQILFLRASDLTNFIVGGAAVINSALMLWNLAIYQQHKAKMKKFENGTHESYSSANVPVAEWMMVLALLKKYSCLQGQGSKLALREKPLARESSNPRFRTRVRLEEFNLEPENQGWSAELEAEAEFEAMQEQAPLRKKTYPHR